MVRVPGRFSRVSANGLVERAARVIVYVNNHDSAIVKVVILRMIMELQSRLGPSTLESAASYINQYSNYSREVVRSPAGSIKLNRSRVHPSLVPRAQHAIELEPRSLGGGTLGGTDAAELALIVR